MDFWLASKKAYPYRVDQMWTLFRRLLLLRLHAAAVTGKVRRTASLTLPIMPFITIRLIMGRPPDFFYHAGCRQILLLGNNGRR